MTSEIGLSYSRTVGPYSYLKIDDYGFFIIDFKLPEECEFVEFSFRTWTASDDIISLDPRIYVVDVENSDWVNSMNALARRIGKWYELEGWSSMMSRFFDTQIIHRLKTTSIEKLRTEITSFKADADNKADIMETLLFIIDAHDIVHGHHQSPNLMLERLNALLERKSKNVRTPKIKNQKSKTPYSSHDTA